MKIRPVSHLLPALAFAALAALPIAAARTAPFQNFSTRQPRRSMNTAGTITTASFASSLGCRRTIPRPTQRCDPFVAGNRKTAAMSATTAAYSRTVSHGSSRHLW